MLPSAAFRPRGLSSISLILIVCVALLGRAPVAHAQQPAASKTPPASAAKQQARAHHERATRLYEVGKYLEAIVEYQKAYELGGDAIVLFNIAQAYRLANQRENAIRSYRAYLRRDPESKYREFVEEKLAELEESPATQPPVATSPPPSGATPPAQPHAGETTPHPAKPGPTNPATTPTVEHTPPGAVATGGAGDSGSKNTSPGRSTRKILTYSLLGGGAGLLAVGLVAGIVANGKASELEEASADEDVFDPDVESAGQTANTVAIVTLSVGAGAVVAGGVLWFLSRRGRPENEALPPSLSSDSTTTTSTWAVPWVSPTGVGFSSGIAF